MQIDSSFQVTTDNRQAVVDLLCMSFRAASSENQNWMKFGLLHFKTPPKGASFKEAVESLDDYSLQMLAIDFQDNELIAKH